MLVIESLFLFITWGVTAIIVAAIILIVLRSLFNYLDVNPFNWSARTVRRVTDPVIMPVRRVLMAFRIDPKVAPFIAVILIIVVGYLVVQVAGSVLNTVAGIILALSSGRIGAPVAIIGYVIYGFLGLYTLAIFIRIVLSWISMSYANPLMRFFIRTTEPLMGPLRRMVPLVGMFDISPIVAFLILWLCQAAVAGTLLRGWPARFF
ncbi:MAG: YggT family protein [Acidobacteriota bacterium]